MTLRLPFSFQQLLFAIVCALLACGGSVKGQDTVFKTDNTQLLCKVVGATATGVQVETPQGTVVVPKVQIKEVRMAVIPAEFAAAQKAIEARNYDAALAQLKPLEKFKGLNVDWAQQATAMVGDAYIEKGDVPKAEAAYNDFQKFYPGGAQAGLGLAKLAIAKKEFAKAKPVLEGLVAKAEADKSVNRSTGYTYSQAFYLLGQVKESENELNAALENYLKTVTLYYYDRASVALAQQKADELRKAHPEVFVP